MPDPSTTPTAPGATTTTKPEIKDPAVMAGQDHTVEIALGHLLGAPPPVDWQDPLARERRRELLRMAARAAAQAAVELLAHAHLCAGRGATLQPGDPVVGAMCDAVVGLHRALWAYQHDTLLYDGGEVVTNAMEDEAGAGVAAIVDGLLTRLRYSPSRSSTGSYS